MKYEVRYNLYFEIVLYFSLKFLKIWKALSNTRRSSTKAHQKRGMDGIYCRQKTTIYLLLGDTHIKTNQQPRVYHKSPEKRINKMQALHKKRYYHSFHLHQPFVTGCPLPVARCHVPACPSGSPIVFPPHTQSLLLFPVHSLNARNPTLNTTFPPLGRNKLQKTQYERSFLH